MGYELATVIISSFCRDLLIKVIASGACYQRDARTPDSEPPAVSMTLYRLQRYEEFLKPLNYSQSFIMGFNFI